MGRYFNYFKVPFIITVIISVICIFTYVSTKPDLERKNESDLKKNVYDSANRMSDKQVALLEEKIAAIEEKYPIDIAVVILDESLAEDYPASDGYYVRKFADEFAEEHKMGYDGNMGSNLVFVDNLHREETTGRVDSWISTCGYARNKITDSESVEIMDIALEGLKDSSNGDEFFNAYSQVIDLIPKYMNGWLSNILKPVVVIIVALIVCIIYIMFNWDSKLGDKTTSGTTYVSGGRPNIRQRSDLFLRKTVTKVKIESSSGGGGGGGSHGGGGHSR